MNPMLGPHPSMRPRHAVDIAATPKRPKSPVPVATEMAIHVTTGDGREVPLSYWDVWYALLAKDRFDGDLERLVRELRELRKGSLYSDDAKRKLSHLRDLQQRLTKAGIGLADVLAAILADSVFQAALASKDGGHWDFLSKKHAQLLHGKWSPDPRK